MRKIGIFGGSFDPVHCGHLMLAEQARSMADLDKVVFMPAWSSPFKISRKQAESADRYEMVRRAISGNDFFEISDLEIAREEVSYTIHTMRELKKRWGDSAKLYFITGTDAFLTVEEWSGAGELLTEYAFLIGTRPGFKTQTLTDHIENMRKKYGADICKIDIPKMDISSTDIREKLEKGRSIRYFVPEKTAEYIYERELYAAAKDRITAYIKESLTTKRLAHTMGVAKTAVALAERYGADSEKAELAALFHDAKRNTGNLEHGKYAALLMKNDYGIKDLDMINAVTYHTTGRAGMSLLEKILYLSDGIEPGRKYPGVKELRLLAEEDLDFACFKALAHTIEYLQSADCDIEENTIKAKNELEELLKRKGYL